ncbi:MAG: redoxin domain-containing protein [Planctomycetaceae bacterium]|nr:redoxin domain-containing protein [Planctomycetaceae bacterium]
MMLSEFGPRRWMYGVLWLAGIYNLVWGLSVVAFPQATLAWIGLSAAGPPAIWQCLGMVIGVYGIGYLIAASDPFRHWPIVLVGLLGKILGPLGFAANLLSGALPASMGRMILLNDVIWWIPFGGILWGALRFHQGQKSIHAAAGSEDDPVRELTGTTGQSLYELSTERPLLVVFLRHTGCTFCREALADLQRERASIEETGTGIALVHLGDENFAATFFASYGLDDVPRYSDPTCRLYRQFGLELGRFRQLFGLSVLQRGLKAAFIERHGLGVVRGNPFQMPGAFVLRRGKIVGGYRHEAASDRPSYSELVRNELQTAEPLSVGCPVR